MHPGDVEPEADGGARSGRNPEVPDHHGLSLHLADHRRTEQFDPTPGVDLPPPGRDLDVLRADPEGVLVHVTTCGMEPAVGAAEPERPHHPSSTTRIRSRFMAGSRESGDRRVHGW